MDLKKINFKTTIGLLWGIYKIYKEIIRKEKTTKQNTVKHNEVKSVMRPYLIRYNFSDIEIDTMIKDIIFYIKKFGRL
jgi:hypothetical protein